MRIWGSSLSDGNEKLGVNQNPFSLKEIDPGLVGYEPTSLLEAFL